MNQVNIEKFQLFFFLVKRFWVKYLFRIFSKPIAGFWLDVDLWVYLMNVPTQGAPTKTTHPSCKCKRCLACSSWWARWDWKYSRRSPANRLTAGPPRSSTAAGRPSGGLQRTANRSRRCFLPGPTLTCCSDTASSRSGSGWRTASLRSPSPISGKKGCRVGSAERQRGNGSVTVVCR